MRLTKDTTSVCSCSVITCRGAARGTFQSSLSRASFTRPSGISTFWKELVNDVQSFQAPLQARLKHNMKSKSSAYTVSAMRLPTAALPLSWPDPTPLLLISLLAQGVHSPKRCQFTFLGFW